MAEPVLTAERVAVPEAAGEYPLANQAGLSMLTNLLVADKAWSACTKPQKALLSELCPPVAEQLLEMRELTAEDMPVLSSEIRTVTRAALERRGLVDGAGRLTGKAVHAWYYAGRLKVNGGGHG